MATNTEKNTRIGAIKGRSQVYNPATGHYIKRDSLTGKFMDVKNDGKPFKGVRKETSIVRTNPNLNKEIANKAEAAVIAIRNRD
jgi:hypothetical protein